MPIGEPIQAAYVIYFETRGAESAISTMGRVRTAQESLQRTGRQIAETTRTTAVATRQYNRALSDTGRLMFRYTYYALIMLRIGQVLLARKILQAPIRAAQEADLWVRKLRALAPEVRGVWGEIEAAAIHMALTLPYTFAESLQAMEKLYRVGRPIETIAQEAAAISKLAVISGRTLEAEAGLVGTVLNVFAGRVEGAVQVVDELAKAMTLSRFSIGDLDAALSRAMATAAAFNQSFESTLTLITAFGRAGIEAARAGTMVRRLIVRIGEPDVMRFYEQVLAIYPEAVRRWNELVQLGRVQGPIYEVPQELPSLYDPETGDIVRDLGRAVVATAQTLKIYIQAADTTIERIRRWKEVQTALYELFGIRQIEPFLALGELAVQAGDKILRGVEAYDYLRRQIAEATGYTEEYLQEFIKSWQYARAQWEASGAIFLQSIGTTMSRIYKPLYQLRTEFVNFLTLILRGNPALRDLAGAVTLVGGGLSFVAGTVGVASATFAVFRGRLADIGKEALRSGVALKRLGTATLAAYQAGRITEAGLGMRYLLSFIISPLRMIANLLWVVVGLWGLWELNIGNVQERARKFFSDLQDRLDRTGSLAQAVVGWFRSLIWREPRPEDILRARGGIPMVRAELTPLGQALMGLKEGIIAGFKGFFTALYHVGAGIWKILSLTYKYVLRPMFGFVSQIALGFFKIIGFGDIRRGTRILGTILGVLIGIRTLLAMWRLGQLGFHALARVGRRIWGWIRRGGGVESWTFAGGRRGFSITRAFFGIFREAARFLWSPITTIKRWRAGLRAVGSRVLEGILRKFAGARRLFGSWIGRGWNWLREWWYRRQRLGIVAEPLLMTPFEGLFSRWFRYLGGFLSPLRELLTSLISVLGGIGSWLTSTLFNNLSQWFGHLAGLLAGWLASKGKRALEWLKNLWPGLAAAWPWLKTTLGAVLPWLAPLLGAGAGIYLGLRAAAPTIEISREGLSRELQEIDRLAERALSQGVDRFLTEDLLGLTTQFGLGAGTAVQHPALTPQPRFIVVDRPTSPNVQQDISVNVQVSVPPGTDGDTAQRTAEETARAVEETMRRILAEQEIRNLLEDYTRPKIR